MVRWTICKMNRGYDLKVCFDADSEGIEIGHDWCGNFASIREAVEAAYHDSLSAPETTSNHELRAMTDDARIAKSVDRITAELKNSDEATLTYPLAETENRYE